MDWYNIGAAVAAIAAGAYATVKSRMASKKAETASVVSKAAAAEVMPPPNTDRPSLYDIVVTVRDAQQELGTLIRAHRNEYLNGLQDVRNEIRDLRNDLSSRVERLESVVDDHKITETGKRILALEAQVKLIVASKDSRPA